jgi:glycosyltransferase involved in cell wall biosynthesis
VAKILYCGDVGVQTGFGRVAEYLIPALAKEHEVHAMCTNWHGDPSEMQQYCRMYPAMAYGGDPFGSHRLRDLIGQIQPDLVFAINDIWVAINLFDTIKELKQSTGFKWITYTPIDSYGLFPELINAINEWDALITYTQFAKEEIQKIDYDKPVHVVGHGTDFSKFFPMDKAQARDLLGVPQDLFIVFNGNRNQPRKRIDLTIKGFIEFALDKPDARLWLNMGQKDMGWDIVPLFKRVARDYDYDATGKLILSSPDFGTQNCLSIEQLNQVYNAVDVGVNTCLGEGWGLVNTEHAAAGVAQVVPDHTSLKEIFNGTRRILIESWETDRNYGLERGQPSPSDLASILDGYYKDRKGLQEAGDWCYSRVHEEQFTWPYVQKQMVKIIEETLNSSPQDNFKGFGTPARIN